MVRLSQSINAFPDNESLKFPPCLPFSDKRSPTSAGTKIRESAGHLMKKLSNSTVRFK
jgi:hypothetical protein